MLSWDFRHSPPVLENPGWCTFCVVSGSVAGLQSNVTASAERRQDALERVASGEDCDGF